MTLEERAEYRAAVIHALHQWEAQQSAANDASDPRDSDPPTS